MVEFNMHKATILETTLTTVCFCILRILKMVAVKNTTTKKRPSKKTLEREIFAQTDLLDMSVNRMTIKNMSMLNKALSVLDDNDLLDQLVKGSD